MFVVALFIIVLIFQDHEDSCRFTPQPCPNSCGKLVSKEELYKHLKLNCRRRLVKCSYCDESLEAAELEVIIACHADKSLC